MKTIQKHGNKFGLGWDVFDLTADAAVRIYHTPTRDDADNVCNLLNETGNLDLVPGSKFNFQYVLLKVNDYHYLYNNEVDAEKAMLLHMRLQIVLGHKGYVKYNIPDSASDADDLKYYTNHNKLYDTLISRIKKNNYKGIYTIFDYFENDNYEFVKFNNLKY